jgi:hypothetical protein
MNSISKISRDALERMFPKGKSFKNSNGGVTIDCKWVESHPGFDNKPFWFVMGLPGNFSCSSDEYTAKTIFHVYGLEMGLERLSDELLQKHVLLFGGIACNPRSCDMERTPFYLVIEIQHHYRETEKIDRWCRFYAFTESERTELENYRKEYRN